MSQKQKRIVTMVLATLLALLLIVPTIATIVTGGF